ncbi:DNA-binding protein [Devosia sp. XJ19-1]|uniref:DNA-binding protein n=1 Tax=Devosia ureilytica TaxID=2952754 RepID=A0A9Q4FV51_9HYPH|nr:DNA-binding protein [Devosia ureilytica]MCP8885050.1 DNA-binding protein [Devosia ureilytica]MCP8889030.1 DNA-binding protein [Devosia ureilytica]
MSAEIASLEKVRAAVAQLHLNNQRATADAVIAAIGGGSKPTVLRHLKTLREELPQVTEDLPAGVLDLVRPIVAQIFAEGSKAEAARTRDQIERLHRMLGDLEAELETLGSVNAALDDQVIDLGKELERSSKALSSAEALIMSKNRKIEKLAAQLSEKEMAAQRQLAAAMKGFDERLTTLAKQLATASEDTK